MFALLYKSKAQLKGKCRKRCDLKELSFWKKTKNYKKLKLMGSPHAYLE